MGLLGLLEFVWVNDNIRKELVKFAFSGFLEQVVQIFGVAKFWTLLCKVDDISESDVDEMLSFDKVLDWCHLFSIFKNFYIFFRQGQSLGIHLGF